MDRLGETWRLRLRDQLKTDRVGYRDLAEVMDVSYTTVQKQLSGGCAERNESLWFIRRACRAMDYSMLWLIFGHGNAKNDHESITPQCPWLDRIGVKDWLLGKIPDPNHLLGWFNTPSVMPSNYDRTFVWSVQSNEMALHGFPRNTWIYIDPDRQVVKRDGRGRSPIVSVGSPVCLVKVLKTDGLMLSQLETVADQVWCLPSNERYPVFKLEDVDIIGAISGSFLLCNQ